MMPVDINIQLPKNCKLPLPSMQIYSPFWKSLIKSWKFLLLVVEVTQRVEIISRTSIPIIIVHIVCFHKNLEANFPIIQKPTTKNT